MPLPPNRGRLTFRLQYWHQSDHGESQVHNTSLGEFLREWLLLEENSPLGTKVDARHVFPRAEAGQARNVVPVQVDLVHRLYTYDSNPASAECRTLWAKLKLLPASERFRHLFSGQMIAMNIIPLGLRDDDARRHDFTFGIVVQSFAVEVEDIVHASEHPWAFLGDSAVLSASILALIAKYFTAPVTATRSTQDDLTSLAAVVRRANTDIRTIHEAYKNSEINARTALSQTTAAVARSRRLFNESYVVAGAAINRVCGSQDPKGEDVFEALVSIRKMSLLFSGVAEGSRSLVTTLKSRKKTTNILVGTAVGVGLVAGIFAAGFFFGPAWLAGASIYAWFAAGTAGTTTLAVGGSVGGLTALVGGVTLGIKVPWENGRFENILQRRQGLNKALEKLSFYAAACWMESVWKMKFEGLPEAERKEYLRSLGADPAYFGIREYRLAQFRTAFKEFQEIFAKLQGDFDGLYKDLGVSTETQHREVNTGGSLTS